MSGDSSIFIRANSLSRVYGKGTDVVSAISDVSFEVKKGEFVALIGSSGSGKSTLLNLIGGLDTPTSGNVEVGGVDIGKLNDRGLSDFRNNTIGFIFQFFYLQPFLNLRKNIEVATMPSRMKQAERTLRVDWLSKQVGLSDYLERLPSELSGGQVQRAAIVRALVNYPSVVLADEPTGNLDQHNSSDVIRLFKNICGQLGTTVIVATHSRAIADVSDRVMEIEDGIIV